MILNSKLFLSTVLITLISIVCFAQALIKLERYDGPTKAGDEFIVPACAWRYHQPIDLRAIIAPKDSKGLRINKAELFVINRQNGEEWGTVKICKWCKMLYLQEAK